MFGIGPMEMLLGGVCCSGVGIAAIAAVVLSLNRPSGGQQNLDHRESAMLDEIERLRAEVERLKRDQSG